MNTSKQSTKDKSFYRGSTLKRTRRTNSQLDQLDMSINIQNLPGINIQKLPVVGSKI